MLEIRIHGLGGQGAVTCSYLIATGAFLEGFYAQAFPMFGIERRGAPARAFVRISKEKIKLREQIYNPDIILIMHEGLIEKDNALIGVKNNGTVIVNAKKEEKLKKDNINFFYLDLTKMALEHLGRNILSTAMFGAFCGITGIIKYKTIKDVLPRFFKGELLQKNILVTEKAFEVARKMIL